MWAGVWKALSEAAASSASVPGATMRCTRKMSDPGPATLNAGSFHGSFWQLEQVTCRFGTAVGRLGSSVVFGHGGAGARDATDVSDESPAVGAGRRG